ncbi:MAG: outer membrane beta-barrel protein [Terracidiphilus sp.]
MKRFFLAYFFVAFSSALSVTAYGQSEASAFHRSYSIYAGAEGSVFQPDYAGNGYAGNSPQRLYGIGAFGDARFNRWAQVEAEARWLRFNEYFGIYQNTYSIGPRIPIKEDMFRHFTPYGKVLIGWGTMYNLAGKALAFTYGGGVDYKLNSRFKIRIIDIEYQQWRVVTTNGLGQVVPNDLWPYGASVGLSYRVY